MPNATVVSAVGCRCRTTNGSNNLMAKSENGRQLTCIVTHEAHDGAFWKLCIVAHEIRLSRIVYVRIHFPLHFLHFTITFKR